MDYTLTIGQSSFITIVDTDGYELWRGGLPRVPSIGEQVHIYVQRDGQRRRGAYEVTGVAWSLSDRTPGNSLVVADGYATLTVNLVGMGI